MTKKLNEILYIAILATLVLASYWGATNNGYVWDDRYFLVDYTWFDSPESALKTVLSPLFMGHSYVRPLPLLTLYAEAVLSGKNPAISHAVNLAIHLLCSSLVFLLARTAFKITKQGSKQTPWPALAIAAVFATHPALSETVLWVSCRFDLLATLFMLLALKVAGSDITNKKRAIAISSLFLLSALSKEIAVVFPIIFATNEILRESARSGLPPTLKSVFSERNIQAIAGMFIMGLIYLLIRYQVLDDANTLPDRGIPILERLALISSAIPNYIQLSFAPFFGNSPQHSFSWNQADIYKYIFNLTISTVLITSTIVLILKKKPLGWLLFTWTICFIPVIHIIPIDIGNNSIQQRFMYLPMAVTLSMSPYVFKQIELSRSFKATLIALLLAFLTFSIMINRSITKVWENDLVLWKWTTQTDPGSTVARENLIWAYLDRGMYKEVDKEAEQLRLTGAITGPNALINVGVSHHRRRDFKTALYYYEIAYRYIQEIPPQRRAGLLSNMAVAYVLTGETEKAGKMIREAIDYNPQNHIAIGNLLAFCKGHKIDTSEFGEDALKRSRQHEEEMNKLLDEYGISRTKDASGATPLCLISP